MIKGIDVAKWNGTIDWKKAKADGVQFAILKVINKSNNKEDAFDKNYEGVTAEGIEVGAYNYSYAQNLTQARKAAAAVLKALNGRRLGMKIWLDVEDNCQKGIGKTLADIINEYQRLIEADGYEFGVYTGLSFYNSYIKPYRALIDCDFWIARYPSSKTMKLSADPASSKKPSIMHNLWGWQFSSKGSVAGISGNVDLDICYVDIKSETAVSTTVYFPKYTGNSASITVALNALGITSTYAYRKQIAKANGITSYVGSAKQNTQILNLLKLGKLERP